MEENEILVFGDLNSEIRTEQKQAKLNEKYGYYISLNSVQMTNAQSRRQREMVIPQGQTSEEIILIVFNLTRAFLHPVFLIPKVVRSDFRMLIYYPIFSVTLLLCVYHLCHSQVRVCLVDAE